MMKSPKYRRELTPEEQKLCDERIVQAYNDLHRWIRWLASTQQIYGNWYMAADDICGEAYWILIKVSRVYLHKPYNEFKVLCKASIHNAISSMRYRIALTHRKAELMSLSLDEPYGDSDDTMLADFISHSAEGMSDNAYALGMNPEHYVQAAEEYLEIAETLSNLDIAVLDACLGFDERVGTQIKLVSTRKQFVYAKNSSASITITPLIVARALNEPLEAVEESFQRLRGLF